MRISDWSSDVCSSDLATQAQLCRAKEAIHDVVRRAEAVVHQLPVAFRPYYEQRRQFALRDAGGELDIDLLPVVEGAQRLPRRTTAAARVAEAQVLQRQPGIDRRGGTGRDRKSTRLNSSP